MDKRQKELLQPFAYIFHFWDTLIERYTDEELAALQAACEAATVSNCWYCTFDVAKTFLPRLHDEIGRRATIKRALPS